MVMAIESEFAEWFATLTVEPFVGTGAWGEVFGSAVEVPAFWDWENRVITTSDGKQVVSDTRVYAGAEHRGALAEGAKVTLPEDTRVYRVAAIKAWPGDDTHIEVSLV